MHIYLQKVNQHVGVLNLLSQPMATDMDHNELYRFAKYRTVSERAESIISAAA